MGYGVWAIIYGQLITATIISALVWFFCPWRPHLRFNVGLLRQLWQYGRHIVGSQVMVFFITNIDDAFVGRFKGDEGLGVYSLAYDLSNLPATHLSRIMGQVMFPAFSRVQNDLGRLRSAFFTSTRYIALAAIPITIITMVFAEDFIVVAYGKKWYQAVTPLQLLAIYGLARAIAVNMGNVFKAGGRPKWLLYIATWRLITMAALLYPAIKLAGINGVAALSALVSILDFVLSLALANRILQAPWRRYSETLLPMLLAAAGTTLLCHQGYLAIANALHPFISLPLMGGLALVLYAGLMYAYDPELRMLVGKALATLQEYRRARLARSQARA
jgi:O-antigen/teichoic acid export membrane protein